MTKRIIFANTLWFIINFKSSLIQTLSEDGDLTCLYLREGPVIDSDKLKRLHQGGIKFKKLSATLFVRLLLASWLGFIGARNSARSITVFTIGPILISSFLFLPQIGYVNVVLEGLGRLFSSRRIKSRIIKRLVEIYYRFYFRLVRSVVVLNAMDAAFLASRKIAPYHKIRLAPGTGIDINNLEQSVSNCKLKPKYIDYIGRFLPEKGVYSFIYSKSLLDNMSLDNDKYTYRLILPNADISNMDAVMKRYLENAGIYVYPYSPNPVDYYKESALIVHPTEYAEGLSRVVMEAAFLGIPLVTTRSKGIEELLVDDYDFFLSSVTPFRIASLVYRALQSYEYFQRITEMHRKQIRRLYSQKSSDAFFKKVICTEEW